MDLEATERISEECLKIRNGTGGVASVFEIELRMERGLIPLTYRFARQVSICCNFRSDSILLVSGMTRVAGIPNLAQLDIDRFDVTGTGDFL